MKKFTTNLILLIGLLSQNQLVMAGELDRCVFGKIEERCGSFEEAFSKGWGSKLGWTLCAEIAAYPAAVSCAGEDIVG